MTYSTFHSTYTDEELLAVTLDQLENDPGYTPEMVMGFHAELQRRGLTAWWSATQELPDEQLLAITDPELNVLPPAVRESFEARMRHRGLWEQRKERHLPA